MPITDAMVLEAWKKAGGRCECSRLSHNHTYVCCARLLKWDLQGQNVPGGWQPNYHTGFSSGTLLGCEILCISCFQRI